MAYPPFSFLSQKVAGMLLSFFHCKVKHLRALVQSIHSKVHLPLVSAYLVSYLNSDIVSIQNRILSENEELIQAISSFSDKQKAQIINLLALGDFFVSVISAASFFAAIEKVLDNLDLHEKNYAQCIKMNLQPQTLATWIDYVIQSGSKYLVEILNIPFAYSTHKCRIAGIGKRFALWRVKHLLPRKLLSELEKSGFSGWVEDLAKYLPRSSKIFRKYNVVFEPACKSKITISLLSLRQADKVTNDGFYIAFMNDIVSFTSGILPTWITTSLDTIVVELLPILVPNCFVSEGE